jgi:hypothetical protein
MAVARPVTKLADRFDVGAPVFIQYDLKEHKIVRTVRGRTRRSRASIT